MIVYKFGGASISNIERLQKVINIVKSIPTNENAILVISAMGKTTNALEKVVTSFYNQQRANALSLFDIIKEQHLSISKYLLVQQFNACLEQLSNIFTEIEWLLHDNPVKPFDYYYDQIVCSGELMSSTIFHFYCLENNIPSKWIDVRDVMLTDNNFRDASIDWQVTEQKVKKVFLNHVPKIYITQGFIGATTDNESTTLGREGSDFTAAILGNILEAKSVTIWKDVEGVMNADPKYFPEAVFIPELNYNEVIEMAYYGAQVIHPKTIQPLQKKKIPLLVKCFLNTELPGTIIHHTNHLQLPTIHILKDNQALISLQSIDFSFVGGVAINEIYAILQELKLIPNLIQFGAITVQICLDDKPEKLTQFALAASNHFEVQVTKNLYLFTVRHYDDAVVQNVNNMDKVVLRQQTPITIQMLRQRN